MQHCNIHSFNIHFHTFNPSTTQILVKLGLGPA